MKRIVPWSVKKFTRANNFLQIFTDTKLITSRLPLGRNNCCLRNNILVDWRGNARTCFQERQREWEIVLILILILLACASWHMPSLKVSNCLFAGVKESRGAEQGALVARTVGNGERHASRHHRYAATACLPACL